MQETDYGDTSINPIDFEAGSSYDIEIISIDPHGSASISTSVVTAPDWKIWINISESYFAKDFIRTLG